MGDPQRGQDLVFSHHSSSVWEVQASWTASWASTSSISDHRLRDFWVGCSDRAVHQVDIKRPALIQVHPVLRAFEARNWKVKGHRFRPLLPVPARAAAWPGTWSSLVRTRCRASRRAGTLLPVPGKCRMLLVAVRFCFSVSFQASAFWQSSWT